MRGIVEKTLRVRSDLTLGIIPILRESDSLGIPKSPVK